MSEVCSALKIQPWRASAGYLYILRLQPRELAWEYLRRNPDYRLGWSAFDQSQLRLDPHWRLKCPRRSFPRRTRRAANLG